MPGKGVRLQGSIECAEAMAPSLLQKRATTQKTLRLERHEAEVAVQRLHDLGSTPTAQCVPQPAKCGLPRLFDATPNDSARRFLSHDSSCSVKANAKKRLKRFQPPIAGSCAARDVFPTVGAPAPRWRAAASHEPP